MLTFIVSEATIQHELTQHLGEFGMPMRYLILQGETTKNVPSVVRVHVQRQAQARHGRGGRFREIAELLHERALDRVKDAIDTVFGWKETSPPEGAGDSDGNARAELLLRAARNTVGPRQRVVVGPPAKFLLGRAVGEQGPAPGVSARPEQDGERREAPPPQLQRMPRRLVSVLRGLLPVPIEAVKKLHAVRRRRFHGGQSPGESVPSGVRWRGAETDADMPRGAADMGIAPPVDDLAVSVARHPLRLLLEAYGRHVLAVARGRRRGRQGGREGGRRGGLLATLALPPERGQRAGRAAVAAAAARPAGLALGGVLVLPRAVAAARLGPPRPRPRAGEVSEDALGVVALRVRPSRRSRRAAPPRRHGHGRHVGGVPRLRGGAVDGARVRFVLEPAAAALGTVGVAIVLRRGAVPVPADLGRRGDPVLLRLQCHRDLSSRARRVARLLAFRQLILPRDFFVLLVPCGILQCGHHLIIVAVDGHERVPVQTHLRVGLLLRREGTGRRPRNAHRPPPHGGAQPSCVFLGASAKWCRVQ